MLLLLTALSITSIFDFTCSDSTQESTVAYGTPNSKSPSTNTSKKTIRFLNNNVTFIDKEAPHKIPNMLIKPEEVKVKRKTFKKSPKRTIQKIIKKMKRRMYLNAPTVLPTQAHRDNLNPYNILYNDAKTQSEFSTEKSNSNGVTTERANLKKQKKINIKMSRYPMPFQKLARNKELLRNERMYMRNKRSGERNDLFIINDLDEVEFVKEKNDYDIVNAHVQKPW